MFDSAGIERLYRKKQYPLGMFWETGISEGMLSVSDAAAKAELSEGEFVEKMQEYVEK